MISALKTSRRYFEALSKAIAVSDRKVPCLLQHLKPTLPRGRGARRRIRAFDGADIRSPLSQIRL